MMNNRTAIHVKQNGAGDYTTIQEAINSIKDASESKQYAVYVHDDFLVNNLTRLWYVHTLEQVTEPRHINAQAALIIPKHWVNIIGVGAPKVIELVSPRNLPAGVYQFIQIIYPMGNCVIDNFKFIITGGRYAIHQESGGSQTHPDYWATTVYKNIYAEHKGNQGYPDGVWESIHAQANGTTSGTRMIHINCEWKANNFPPYYTHTNMEFDGKNTLVFDNCKMHLNELKDVRWSDLGSGFKANIVIRNSELVFFNIINRIRGLERHLTNADNWSNGGAEVSGGGNRPMTVFAEAPATLYFEAAASGDDIKPVGGDAAPLIIGGEFMHYDATADRPGAFWAQKRIQQVHAELGNTRVFTLPHRLGNCAEHPKTLIIEVGGQEVTIVFDENYVTEDGQAYRWDTEPVITTEQIIAAINRASGGNFICRTGELLRIYSFRDCMTSVRNKTSATINLGRGLVRDYAAGWSAYRPSRTGEIPDVIAAERIAVYNPCKTSDFNGILFHKAIFRGIDLGLPCLSAGNLVKTVEEGRFALTTEPAEAVMVVLDDQFVRAVGHHE